MAQWLRYCDTNRKVADSIPDGVIGIFHLNNPSDRTMALGAQWLRYCATNRKVAGSMPDGVIGILH